MSSFKSALAVVVCWLLIFSPALAELQAAGQHAGQINAMIPSATKNSQPAKVQEELQWNDLLQTQHTGRVRAGLADGSIISLGSDSELRIVQHDAASQQTSLEMNYGKVRSQVQKIATQGGKFEMKTPNAVIGVIGTDFYVAFENNATTVICYEGTLSVTPLGSASAMGNTGQAAGNSVTVGPGQMVVVTTEIPPSGFHVSQVPPSAAQNGILATNIPEKGGPAPPPHNGHVWTWVGIGAAVGVGLGLGLYYGTQTPGTPACNPNQPAKGCPGR
jgi:FecR protein